MTTSRPPRAQTGPARFATEDGLEDYALRYVPRSFRRWSAGAVGATALGSIAFLADFSIGAGIGLAHGALNAIVGILLASVLIFIIGYPIARHAARFNLDLDLITRGAGFGYAGSVITNAVFASFTIIFFALEGAIMAQGLSVGIGIPLPIGYLIATIVVIPIVIYGMRALERVQRWTTPLWLGLALLPVGILVLADPGAVSTFLEFPGSDGGPSGGSLLDPASVVLSASVCFALIPQLAEQIDYLRLMPPRTAATKRGWRTSFVLAGPGWVIFSGVKQLIGVFLAVYLVSVVDPTLGSLATEPIRQFLGVYETIMPRWVAVVLALLLVILAQIKINVTNAYSGSLALTNVTTRLFRRYPGRAAFVVVNVGIALLLMQFDVFTLLTTVLGFSAHFSLAWLVTVAVDLTVNRRLLRLSPATPEFRRGMLYSWNPVGMVSFLLATALSMAVYFGALGQAVAPYSVLVAIGVAVVATPLMAILTRGRFALRRSDDGIDIPRYDRDGTASAERLRCHVTGYLFERPDMLRSAERAPDGGVQYISSLALALDRSGRYVLPADPPRRRSRA